MTWTLFWQFVFLIAWTTICVRLTAPSDRPRRPVVRDHTDDAGVRWIGDRR